MPRRKSTPKPAPVETEAPAAPTPDEAKEAFDAALRALVAAYDRARAVGALFGPVTVNLVNACRVQVEYLEIGGERRLRAAMLEAGRPQ